MSNGEPGGQRPIESVPGAGDLERLGSLRGPALRVVADDGIDLHVEIDEPAGTSRASITAIFVHGYSLNLDSWHFQRAAYRGQLRSVFYDQRSHGRSQLSDGANANIDQLGRDLLRVIEATSDGPVIVIGHSMGGMSIMALAQQFPELIGTRAIGVALISTTAGGLDPGRILFPMLPLGRVSGRAITSAVGVLDRGHRLVDAIRRLGADIADLVIERYAFGEEVPDSYSRFTFDMLNDTPFEVVADFFPSFAGLDKWDVLRTFSDIPCTIICGTDDKITKIEHSRKMHSLIHRSTLFELDGAGHMVQLERHTEVNQELDDLISHSFAKAARLLEQPDSATES